MEANAVLICEVDYDYAEDVQAGSLIRADLRGEGESSQRMAEGAWRLRTPEEILAPYSDPETWRGMVADVRDQELRSAWNES